MISYAFVASKNIQGENETPASFASIRENQPSRNRPIRNYSASSSQNTNDNFKSADFPELDQKAAVNLFPDNNLSTISKKPAQEERPRPSNNNNNNNRNNYQAQKERSNNRNFDRDGKPPSATKSRAPQFKESKGNDRKPNEREYRERRAQNNKDNGSNNNNNNNNSGNKLFAERFKEEEEALRNRFKGKEGAHCFELVKGDLFLVGENVSLAHCVSEDFRMAKGIATEFKKRFEGQQELLGQDKKTGECAFLKRDDKYIFYLITKKYFNHKPYYHCLESSLKSMRKLCEQFEVKRLAMPMIGTGLDKLNWDVVANLIDEVFKGADIQIKICKYEKPQRKTADDKHDQRASKSDSP